MQNSERRPGFGLVLTRGKGERIIIGKDIVVTVLSIEGAKVRLGFEAPPSVAIHRADTGKFKR